MGDRPVVCLPDIPELVHLGDLPTVVEVLLVPPEPAPVPDLSTVELIVPNGRLRPAVLELLASSGGRLGVIQTTTAGVDWLIGRVPEGVRVHNARGVYDGPLAEWVVGAILAMQRGSSGPATRARATPGRASSRPSSRAGGW